MLIVPITSFIAGPPDPGPDSAGTLAAFKVIFVLDPGAAFPCLLPFAM